MYPMYAVVLFALSGLRAVLSLRAGALERKYSRAAVAAELAGRTLQTKPGTASASDPYTQAKRQYELGRLVEARDRAEDVYLAWQAKADKVGYKARRLRAWTGRTVPYLLGVADAVLAVVALGLTVGDVARTVRTWAESVGQ